MPWSTGHTIRLADAPPNRHCHRSPRTWLSADKKHQQAYTAQTSTRIHCSNVNKNTLLKHQQEYNTLLKHQQEYTAQTSTGIHHCSNSKNTLLKQNNKETD